MSTELQTYKIPEENLNEFSIKIEKLNKKCVKLNIPKIIYNVEDTIIEKLSSNTFRKYVIISLSGNAPKLENWEFIAALDHDYSEPIIVKVNSKELPKQYHDHDTSCDHCKINRYRRKTYVLHNTETDEYTHVGKSCLKDFLGHQDPKDIIKWFQYLNDIQINLSITHALSVHTPLYDIQNILELSADFITKTGIFISTSKANEIGEYSTTDSIKSLMFNPIELQKYSNIDNSTKQYVKDALEYFNTLEYSDYSKNCKVLLKDRYIKQSHFGLAVSIIGIYFNMLSKKLNMKNNSLNSCNEYYGNIKDRIEHDVTVISMNVKIGEYGYSYIYTMLDTNGRTFVWFASNEKLKENESYKLKMTIKSHREYNEIKQTTVTRCNIV